MNQCLLVASVGFSSDSQVFFLFIDTDLYVFCLLISILFCHPLYCIVFCCCNYADFPTVQSIGLLLLVRLRFGSKVSYWLQLKVPVAVKATSSLLQRLAQLLFIDQIVGDLLSAGELMAPCDAAVGCGHH